MLTKLLAVLKQSREFEITQMIEIAQIPEQGKQPILDTWSRNISGKPSGEDSWFDAYSKSTKLNSGSTKAESKTLCKSFATVGSLHFSRFCLGFLLSCHTVEFSRLKFNFIDCLGFKIESTSYYSFTKNPQFQFNLTYKLKESINQWRIVIWDPKRQEFTLENPSLNFQRISVPLRSISAFY